MSVLLLPAAPALALPGDLDRSFSGDGQAVTPLDQAGEASGVALAPGGRIVVAGLAWGEAYPSPALVRYAADGTLDSGFSGDGKLVEPGDGDFGAVAVQPDGRIVAVGSDQAPAGGGRTLAVYRYTSAGAPDPTFSGDGKVALPLAEAYAAATDVVLGPDGTIAVAGVAFGKAEPYAVDTVLARVTAGGAPDSTFSGDGVLLLAGADGYEAARGLVRRPDGALVTVSGTSECSTCKEMFRVVRVTAAGELDPGFDGDGVRVVDFPTDGNAGPNGVALQSDGRILVSGAVYDSQLTQTTSALVRLLPGGSLDPSFSGDGRAPVRTTQSTVPPGHGAVMLQPDGRIITIGGSDGLFVSRYTADGQFDPSFSGDGYAEPLTPQIAVAGVTRIADGVVHDGRIVAVGDAPDPADGRGEFMAARVLGGDDPPAPSTPGGSTGAPPTTSPSPAGPGPTPAGGRARLSARLRGRTLTVKARCIATRCRATRATLRGRGRARAFRYRFRAGALSRNRSSTRRIRVTRRRATALRGALLTVTGLPGTRKLRIR